MQFYAIAHAPISPGRTSPFHEKMFHGISWREGRLVARSPFAERYYLDTKSMSPLLIVRHGRIVPHVTDPAPSLVVAETVKVALENLPALGFLPVSFWRLFDYRFETGNYDFERDPRWREYSGEICGKDYAWFYVGLPDEPELHENIGLYFEVLMPSPAILDVRYPEARDLNLLIARGRISQRMIVENSMIHAPPGYFVNSAAFQVLRPYLDPNFFVWQRIEVDFKSHPSAPLRPTTMTGGTG